MNKGKKHYIHSKQNFLKKKKVKEEKPVQNEEITSEEEEDEEFKEIDYDNLFLSDEENEPQNENKIEEVKESVDEIRLREAKEYLEKVSQIVGEEEEKDEFEMTKDPIMQRLKKEELKESKRTPSNFDELVLFLFFLI